MYAALFSLYLLAVGAGSALAEPFGKPTLLPCEAKKHVGKFRKVMGDVMGVSLSAEGTVFLYFGNQNREPVFTVIIPAYARHQFDRANKSYIGYEGDPRKLVGKRILVTDRIAMHKRMPQMVVSDPTRLDRMRPNARRSWLEE